MGVLVSAGVLTREIDFSLYAPQLSTTILGMVGTATKGPVNANPPALITNEAQLFEEYGFTDPNHPAIITARMYLKFGSQLRFVRVGAEGDLLAAEADLASASAGAAVVQAANAQTFAITASTPGSHTGSEIGPFAIVAAVAATRTGTVAQNYNVVATTRGTQLGTVDGPYAVVLNTNDKLAIKIDGGATQNITLTAGGARTATQVAADINGTLTGGLAVVVGAAVSIRTNTYGAGGSVQIMAVANDAYTDLGLTASTATGITGSDRLLISVDGGANITVTLTAGAARTASQVAADLDSALTGEADSDVNVNKVRITSQTTGASSSLNLQTIIGSAYALLGFSTGSTTGTDSNTELSLIADGGASQTVTLTTGSSRAAVDIAGEINAQTTGLNATVSSGAIKIATTTPGAAGSLEIEAVANDAYTTLGLTVDVYDGVDGNDVLLISVNGGGDQTIQLTAGSARTATQIAADINSTLTGGLASTWASGTKVQIVTTATGTGATVQVQAGSSADTVLGFANTLATGTAPGAASMTIAATTPGTWANTYSVQIIDGTTSGTKTLYVKNGNNVLEVFRNLSKTPSNARYYETIINGASAYITVTDNTGVGSQPVNATSSLSGGSDGLDGIAEADYIGVDDGTDRTGLQLLKDPDSIDINLVMVPAVTGMAVHAEMVSICETRHDCFAILDPEVSLTPTQVVDFLEGQNAYSGSRTSVNSSYAAMYYPWIKLYDSKAATTVTAPPSAAAIRTIAFSDQASEVWYAPAGLNRGRVTEAIGIERILTQGERDFLYENRINPIASFTAEGIVVWGQKTLQVAPTALDRVNVRRLLLYLRKVIATASRALIFEPNTPRLWRRFINLVTPVLRDLKSREGLNDFRVVCDTTTNTPLVIDRSEFRARIFVKPTKAAEFIIIDFVLVAQNSTFNEFTDSAA